MDPARARPVSHALPALEGGGVLARTLAKSRSILQQPPRELIDRIAQRLSRRRGQWRLVRGFDPAAATEKIDVCRAVALAKADRSYDFFSGSFFCRSRITFQSSSPCARQIVRKCPRSVTLPR